MSEGKYVKVSIQDEGEGVPEENLPKIFDPYFTTKEMGAERGMGLGLAICHSVMKKHGGYITVESAAGRGSAFTLYLPATNRDVPCTRGEEERDLQGRGRVLMMDDEDIVRDVVGNMLRHHGYKVVLAEHGDKAIEIYNRARESGNPFDIVILDLTVKGGTGGKEVMKRLIKIDPRVKAIVATGYSNNPIMEDYKRYGFRASIAKPFKARDLIDTVKKVLVETEDRGFD